MVTAVEAEAYDLLKYRSGVYFKLPKVIGSVQFSSASELQSCSDVLVHFSFFYTHICFKIITIM